MELDLLFILVAVKKQLFDMLNMRIVDPGNHTNIIIKEFHK